MAKSKSKSSMGLLSEAAKKAGRAIADAAKTVVGAKPAKKRKVPAGNMSEAAKKAGRGVARAGKGKKGAAKKKSGKK